MVGDVVIHRPKIDMHPSMKIKRHPEVSTEVRGYIRTEGKGKKLQKVSWDFYDRCIGELTVLRNECERIAQDFGNLSGLASIPVICTSEYPPSRRRGNSTLLKYFSGTTW